MYVNRNSNVGYRRRGGVPAVLSDGNTVAWFDSAEEYMTKDVSDVVSAWADRSGLNHDLDDSFVGKRPVWSADGVLFDGSADYLKTATFTLEQPEFIYIVFKQVTWTISRYIFDGFTALSMLIQRTATPGLAIFSGGAYSSVDNNLAVGDFGIVRVLFNGASSKLIINDETPVSYNGGANDMDGFTLGASAGTSGSSNIQVKEVIIRKVADTESNESKIYNYLKNKYGL